MILKAIVERGIICQLLLVAAVGQMLCLAVNIVIKHNLKYLEKICKKNKIIISKRILTLKADVSVSS